MVVDKDRSFLTTKDRVERQSSLSNFNPNFCEAKEDPAAPFFTRVQRDTHTCLRHPKTTHATQKVKLERLPIYFIFALSSKRAPDIASMSCERILCPRKRDTIERRTMIQRKLLELPVEKIDLEMSSTNRQGLIGVVRYSHHPKFVGRLFAILLHHPKSIMLHPFCQITEIFILQRDSAYQRYDH